MRHAVKSLIVISTLVLTAGGCATQSNRTATVQPVRTIDEIYTLQAQVNDDAGGYRFGSGDAVGVHTQRQARVLSAFVGE